MLKTQQSDQSKGDRCPEKVAIAFIPITEILIMPQGTITVTPSARTVAELTLIEIDFYDYEVYAASKLIASIGHDDDLTQPWVVLINGVEVFRHNTFKGCHSFITWHYKENTLPEPQAVVSQVNAYTEPVEEAYEEFQPEETTTTEQPIVQPLSDWDFTLPKFNCSPGVICPDCDGHGCGNCGYRGTRAEDLCTPVDGYRLTYVGRTEIQTAYNVHNDGEFLGVLFKVRNPDELWENDPKTYYWRCGDGVQYWSVKEAVEGLSRVTDPIELPRVRRELVAA